MLSVSNNSIIRAINTAINKTPKGLAVTMIVLGSIVLLTGAMGLFTQEIDNLHRFRFIPEWASIMLLSCGVVSFVWGSFALKSKPQTNSLEPVVVPKEYMDFTTFQEIRNPHFGDSSLDPEGIYSRNDGITIGEIPEEQDPRVRLRQDAQPLPSESIGNYLPRIFRDYVNSGEPRGLVFSGLDFLVVGFEDSHPSIAFLQKYLPILQKMGIKKIYFEQMFGFSNHAERINVPYILYKYHYGVDDKILLPRPKELVDIAKKYGMEVIGIEIEGPHLNSTSTRTRLEKANRFGTALIKTINEPFVLFIGAAHGKLSEGIYGISEMLDCPCIGIPTTKGTLPKRVLPGTHRFTSEQYSVDAVLA